MNRRRGFMPVRPTASGGLEDYRGRWLIFFAHPADFTPVCASEFIAFFKAYGFAAVLRLAGGGSKHKKEASSVLA
jgi:peroxiredoxin